MDSKRPLTAIGQRKELLRQRIARRRREIAGGSSHILAPLHWIDFGHRLHRLWRSVSGK